MQSDAAPSLETVQPQWAAPPHVRALSTTRHGGIGRDAYCSFNLATHVGDESSTVQQNRLRLRDALTLPGEPCWLEQTHGTAMVEAQAYSAPPRADACFTTRRGQVCAILTADCLPILLCDRRGSVVVAIHAGWRGLLSNIISGALNYFDVPRTQWIAWIGPGISAQAYAVGLDLAARFCARDPAYAPFFTADAAQGKAGMRADLPGLAAWQLKAAGVTSVARYPGCTAGEAGRFFSYRRDGATGRFATLIWLT